MATGTEILTTPLSRHASVGTVRFASTALQLPKVLSDGFILFLSLQHVQVSFFKSFRARNIFLSEKTLHCLILISWCGFYNFAFRKQSSFHPQLFIGLLGMANDIDLM